MTRASWFVLLTVPLVLSAQEPPKYARDLSDRDLVKQSFKAENLDNVNFEASDLSQAQFDNALARGSNFQGAILEEATLWNVDFTGSDFRKANLKYARCSGAIFNRCNLSGVDLSSTIFLKNSFREADLRNLKGANQILQCDFFSADVRGANLTNAIGAESAKWRKARYDRKTRWPKGFDPEAAGCVLIEEEDPPAGDPPANSPARAAREKEFAKLDVNADGVLSGKEMRPFAKKDTNGDGEVTLDEFLAPDTSK